jgi:hypothetical protein
MSLAKIEKACFWLFQESLFIWKIPAAAAAGWWTTWPEMGFRSAVAECETSCDAWVYGRSTRNRAPRSLVIRPSDSAAWWISAWSWQWTRCGPPISPISRLIKAFSTWWRSWISSPGMCSAGNSPTALTRSSVWMPLRWRWRAAASQRSSTPIKESVHLIRRRGQAAGRGDQDQLVRKEALL